MLLLLLDGLGSLRQTLDLEPLRGLEEGGQLLLGNVDLARVHELKNGGEVLDGDVLEDDDRVLGGVLLEQGLEKKENNFWRSRSPVYPFHAFSIFALEHNANACGVFPRCERERLNRKNRNGILCSARETEVISEVIDSVTLYRLQKDLWGQPIQSTCQTGKIGVRPIRLSRWRKTEQGVKLCEVKEWRSGSV